MDFGLRRTSQEIGSCPSPVAKTWSGPYYKSLACIRPASRICLPESVAQGKFSGFLTLHNVLEAELRNLEAQASSASLTALLRLMLERPVNISKSALRTRFVRNVSVVVGVEIRQKPELQSNSFRYVHTSMYRLYCLAGQNKDKKRC